MDRKPPAPRTGVAYLGNRFLGHARRDLEIIAAVADHVVHTMSETDLYFHKAALAQAEGAISESLGKRLMGDDDNRLLAPLLRQSVKNDAT